MWQKQDTRKRRGGEKEGGTENQLAGKMAKATSVCAFLYEQLKCRYIAFAVSDRNVLEEAAVCLNLNVIHDEDAHVLQGVGVS